MAREFLRQPAAARTIAHKLGRPVRTWSTVRHHLKKTDPSGNRVRLFGGFCFSAYCQRLTSLLECRRYRPDRSFFGKLLIPRISFASKFSVLLPPFSEPRPVCALLRSGIPSGLACGSRTVCSLRSKPLSCIFSCNRCSAISFQPDTVHAAEIRKEPNGGRRVRRAAIS